MALQCRIVYKNDNTIDYLETPQGERSELFDELVQVMGGDKDSALNMYALTESEDFKTLYNGYVENKPTVSVAQAFNAVQEMQAIKDKAIADGTFMKAPNGQPTNLNEQQWLQVRTRAFKEFFGDWQNDPQNASKVVDENGEPKVVYHGTNAKFSEFKNKIGIRGNQFTGSREVKSDTFFFTDDLEYANKASNIRKENFGGSKNIISSFLNIRQPLDFSTFDYQTEEKFNDITGEYPSQYFGYNDNLDQWWRLFDKDEDDVTSIVKEKGYQGVILAEETKTVKDSKGYEIETASIKSFGVFNPNQIKSAEENIGTFSTETNDIRFSAGENQGQRAEREVIDRLKQNGLANNVFEMNTQEINAKLEELGVDAETRKQVFLPENYNTVNEKNRIFLKFKGSSVGQIELLTPIEASNGDVFATINIEIDSKHRGKGLSKFLYTEALKEAKKLGYKGLLSVDGLLQSPEKSIKTRNYFYGRYSTDEKLLKVINDVIIEDNKLTEEDNERFGEEEPLLELEDKVYLIEEQIQFQKTLNSLGIDLMVNGFVVKELPSNDNILNLLISKNIIKKIC